MTDALAAHQPPAIDPRQQLFKIFVGFWQSRALAIATELELADHLAAEPVHLDDLARRTKTHAPSLFRLLRARSKASACLLKPRRRFSRIHP